jgi:anti-sigma B factor antagonist
MRVSDAEGLTTHSEVLEPGITVLTVKGQVNWDTFTALDKAFVAVPISQDGVVVVDMSGVNYVASAGFGSFIAAASQASMSGGRLVFMQTPETVMEVFRLLGLDQTFDYVDTLDEARKLAGNPSNDIPDALGDPPPPPVLD